MSGVDSEIAARGLWVVFGLLFASGLGLPVPSAPVLLAAGVLAGSGRFSIAGVIGGAFVAHLATDFAWYALGRWRGQRILSLLCRISLEPDTCVQRTGDLFARRQSTALVISKFVPGLRIVAAPLAGMLRMPVAGFATWDGLGTLLWVGTLAAIGYLFSEPVARAAAPAARLGSWLVLAVLLAFAGWLGWKSLRRRQFVRDLRVARITPEELHSQLEAGERVTVIDLRSPLADTKVRGALQMAAVEMEKDPHGVRIDKERTDGKKTHKTKVHSKARARAGGGSVAKTETTEETKRPGIGNDSKTEVTETKEKDAKGDVVREEKKVDK